MAAEREAPRAGERRLDPGSQWFHEDRHQSLVEVRDRAITVCGAGALGGTLAETLARMGFSRLTTVDRDRVELRNLSTQPYMRAEVGSPKARALANSLFRAVQARVTPVVAELTAENAPTLLKDAALVLDAFDNSAARAAVSAAASSLGTPCLHVGFSGDGLYGSGIWEPGYTVPGEAGDDPCDYPLTRPFAQTLAALAARSMVQFLLTQERVDFELTWNDARVTFLTRADAAAGGAP
jgi:molybdopterin-synthase adenylyltransferase